MKNETNKQTCIYILKPCRKISQSLEEAIWMNLNWKSEISHVANKVARNRPCGSTSFLPLVTSSVLMVKDTFAR